MGPSTLDRARSDDNPMRAMEAALLRLPPSATFSGLTAAWLHGLDVMPCNLIEVSIPKRDCISARSGMSVRRSALPRSEVTKVRGMRVTSLVRTLAEVCGRLSFIEAVVIADMALHAGGVDIGELRYGQTVMLGTGGSTDSSV